MIEDRIKVTKKGRKMEGIKEREERERLTLFWKLLHGGIE